jgi:Tfp pilus assembly pilus retraction ATPase PilT
MNEMFKKAIEDGASDLHIKAGDFVRARLDGALIPLTEQKISAAQVRELAIKLIPHEKDRERIDEIIDLVHDGKEQYGSQTFDQHLMDLVNDRSVSFDQAKMAANSPSDFDLKMNMLGQGRGAGMAAKVPERALDAVEDLSA